MTRPVLIGVGGSGQHVVHAYLKLLALSFAPPDQLPHVFIIDADATEGNAAAQRSHLIGDIAGLHETLRRGDTGKACWRIVRPYAVNSDDTVRHATLGRLIGVTDAEELKRLAQAFLADDDDAWGNDWNLDLSKGMMANPKVGSLALAHKAQAELDGRDEDEIVSPAFRELFSVLKGGVRVAIAGSNFGGTGSGVIPALVRMLDKRADIGSVRAFLTLPWFTIRANDATGAAQSTSAALDRGDMDPKQRNAALGLHACFEELHGRGGLKRSSYVLTQPMAGWAVQERKDHGNYDQIEYPHVVNLTQACVIQNYLGLGVGDAPDGYLYSLKTTQFDEDRGKFDAKASSHLRFRLGEDDSRQLADVALDAEATAFVLDSAGQLLQKAREGRLTTREGVVPRLGALEDLLNELMRVSGKKRVGGGIFRKAHIPDDVFKSLGAALRSHACRVREWLVWLAQHAVERTGANGVQASGVSHSPQWHLFTTPEQSLEYGQKQIDRWNQLGLPVTGPAGQNISSSSPETQALVLLLNLFALDKEGNPTAAGVGVTAFSELRKLESALDVFSIAALLCGRAVHASVLQTRHGRYVKFIGDKQQLSNPDNSFRSEPMLNFDALPPTTIDDARLVRINLQADIREDQDRMAWTHPLTRACLAPSGAIVVQSGDGPDSGRRLDISGLLAVEHPLRGIPSIAAPQLLQRWRLEKCAPAAAAGEAASAYELSADGSLRMSEAGIYLHARRVVEAAFWLMVSASRRVQFVENLFDARNGATPFARLLRQEMRLDERQPLSALLLGPEEAHAGKPLLLWDGFGWFLAANRAARIFFRELLPQLPSVRMSYFKDNLLLRRTSVAAASDDLMDQYFARELRGVVRQIGAAKNDAAEALRLALEATLQELPKIPDAAPNAHRGTPRVLRLAGVGNIDIAPHRMLTDAAKYVCEHPVVFLAHRGQDEEPVWNGLMPLRAEAWDMLGHDEGARDGDTEHADAELILDPFGERKSDGQTLAARRVDSWRLRLKGVGERTVMQPFGRQPVQAILQELEWSFGIWPNFVSEGWNYYIISGLIRVGNPDPKALRSGDTVNPYDIQKSWLHQDSKVSLVVKGRSPDDPERRLVELGRVTAGLPVRIHGRPEVLELVSGDCVLGSRRIGLRNVDAARQALMLGIDFGTSNTCVALQESKGGAGLMVPLVPGAEFDKHAVPSLLHYLDSSGQGARQADFLNDAAGFFHTRNDDDIVGGSDTIPSELLVTLDNVAVEAKRQKDAVAKVYGPEARPLHEDNHIARLEEIRKYPLATPLFTPLPPQPHGLADPLEKFRWLRRMLEPRDQRLFGDLKWIRDRDDDKCSQSRNLRALYLEQVIVAALATLRYAGFVGFDRFVATQPEALLRMKDTFAKSFGTDLARVVGELVKRTGMKPKPSKPDSDEPFVIVSETEAALRVIKVDQKDSKTSVLTIDIGGGTTDVGVALRYGNAETVVRPFTASARFAGNQLLTALANTECARGWFAKFSNEDTGYAAEAIVPLIKAGLRGGKRLSSLAGFDAEPKGRPDVPYGPRTAHLTTLFFDAIYEYAFNILRRAIQARPDWTQQFVADPDQRLVVALLGNGFRLYSAFQEEQSEKTLKTYNEEIRTKLRSTGMFGAELCDKLDFMLSDAGKNDLIKVGGFDAARDRRVDTASDPVVLLPAGMRSSGTGGPLLELHEPALLPANTFLRQWMGVREINSRTTREIWFKPPGDDFSQVFPLTFEHWENGRKDFQNIFRSTVEFAEEYMDLGALYLVGIPQQAPSSFSKLLIERASVPE